MNCRFKNLDNQEMTLGQANIILTKDVLQDEKFNKYEFSKMSTSANADKLSYKEAETVRKAGEKELRHAMNGAGFEMGDLIKMLEKKGPSNVELLKNMEEVSKTVKKEIEMEANRGRVKDDSELVWSC